MCKVSLLKLGILWTSSRRRNGGTYPKILCASFLIALRWMAYRTQVSSKRRYRQSCHAWWSQLEGFASMLSLGLCYSMSGPGAGSVNGQPVFSYCHLILICVVYFSLKHRVDWALVLRHRCLQKLIPDYFAHLMALSCSIPWWFFFSVLSDKV